MKKKIALAIIALFLLSACSTQDERNCRHMYGSFPPNVVTDWRIDHGTCQVQSRGEWLPADKLIEFVK